MEIILTAASVFALACAAAIFGCTLGFLCNKRNGERHAPVLVQLAALAFVIAFFYKIGDIWNADSLAVYISWGFLLVGFIYGHWMAHRICKEVLQSAELRPTRWMTGMTEAQTRRWSDQRFRTEA